MKIVTVLIATMVISGCASVYTLGGGFDEEVSKKEFCPDDCVVHRVYGGTAMDLCILRTKDAGQAGAIVFFDLPFSFVLDTLALPYTIYKQNTVGGSISTSLTDISACKPQQPAAATDDDAAS